MKPDELLTGFELIFDAGREWWDCVRNPYRALREILQESDERAQFKRAMHLFITSFILTIPLTGWAYQLYGISLREVDFYLASAVLLVFCTLTFAASIYVGQRLFRVPVSFTGVFVTVNVFLSAYSPIVGLLNAVPLASFLSVLKVVRSENLALIPALKSFFEHIDPAGDSPLDVASAFMSIPVTVFTWCQLALIMDSVAQQSGADRFRVFNAGVCGFLLGLVPLVLVTCLYMVTVFSFIGE